MAGNADMAWVEIPGWRQDHRGRIFVTLVNDRSDRRLPRSTDTRYIPAPDLPPARAALYEKIIVESKAYQAALGMEPQNELQRQRRQAILDRGPTYESILFFHQRSTI